MSKINELIEKLCPNGVEYRRLEEICGTITTGKLNAKDMVENGEYPFFTCDANPFKIDKYAFDEEAILISGNGSKVGHINYYNGKFNAYQRTYVLYDMKFVIIKFLFHYLKGFLKDYIMIHSRKGSVPYITLPMLQNFSVPVPPLEIQCEIVHILDKFTSFVVELKDLLKAELIARKKQYEYYKQKMFDDIKTDTIKHITDIAFIKSRVGWQNLTRKEYLTVGDYYLITGTDFTTDGNINFENCVYVSKDRYEMDKNIQVHKDDILITKDGTLGKVAIIKEEPKKEATLNSGIFRITVINSNEVYPNYLYHFFTSRYFKNFVESVKTSSTISHLTQQGLLTLNIPIPNIEEQKKIADVLDKFEQLCNSLTEGIPAEIEARQKQYEYYREKLLTFKELKNE